MITLGLFVIRLGFIGYLNAGFPSACVASSTTFLPCSFSILSAPYLHKIAKNNAIKAFVDGIRYSDCMYGSIHSFSVTLHQENSRAVNYFRIGGFGYHFKN